MFQQEEELKTIHKLRNKISINAISKSYDSMLKFCSSVVQKPDRSIVY